MSAVVTRVIEVDVRASANAQAHIAQIAKSTQGIEEVAKKTNTALSNVVETGKTMLKAFAFLWAAEKIINYTMALNELNDLQKQISVRMNQVTGSTEKGAAAFSEIVRIAKEQGRELDGVSKLYEKIARQQEQLGVTTRGVSLVTEGFASSLRLSGTNTQEANAAMLQFSQALASGKLSGDEYRSMTENNSVFMAELGKAAGKTSGEMKKMSSEGKLDMEFLRTAMLKTGEDGMNMLERMMDKASKLPLTFAMAVNGVKASLAEYLNTLGSAANATEGILAKIAKFLSNGITAATYKLRSDALIANELARARGEKVLDENKYKITPEADAVTQTMEMLNKQKEITKQARADLTKEEAKEGIKRNALAISQLKDKVRDSLAIEMGRQAFLNEISDKGEEKASRKYTVDGWTPPKKLDKDKKSKADVDTPLDRLLKTLQEADAKQDEIEKLTGKMETLVLKTWASMEDAEKKGQEKYLAAVLRYAKAIDFKDLKKDTLKAMAREQEEIQKQLQADKDDAQTRDFQKYTRERGFVAGFARKQSPEEELTQTMARIDAFKREALTVMDIRIAHEAADAAYAIYAERMKKDTKSIADQMADSWVSGFDRMMDGLLNFDKSAKELVADLIISLLRDFAKLEMKEAMKPLMEAGKGLMRDIVGSLFGNANGAAFGNGVRLMASGGILDRPTYMGQTNDGRAQIAGEAGPEAVMPLRRGNDGKLGVGTAPVTVVVNNNAPNSKARTEESTDSNGNKQITIMIEELVEAGIGSGRFDKVMSRSYGSRRKGN